MPDLTGARLVHVVCVVLWIGGVAMVTTVLLPATRRLVSSAERVQFFEKIEAGFARQARWTVTLTGLSGFYLAYRLEAWNRFADPHFWWMHAMVAVWALFTAVLFVLEPLWLHRWFEVSAQRRPEQTFAIIQRLHWLLLIVSLLTVAGAVAGSHGGLL
jgi:uncharacterized membrane protein